MMTSLFFVRNQEFKTIEEEVDNGFMKEKLSFTAGQLTPIGLRTGPEVVEDLHRFLKEKYKFNPTTKKAPSKEGNAAYRFLYYRGVECMMSDATESLTWEKILSWATNSTSDFSDKAYDLAISINPKLDTARAAELAVLGKAQAGTHDAEGNPVEEGETPLG